MLFTLDFQARMPLSQLGKKLKISKQVAKYRIERLQKEKIIQGFYTDINASKLGLAIYLVYLKFHHLSPIQEKEFIQYLGKQRNVGVSVSLNGKWDYTFGIWAESIIHFKKAYYEIMRSYEKYVAQKTIMIETDFFYFKPRQIWNGQNSQIMMTGELEYRKLDQKDRIILSKLAQDARISLVDLGKSVSLSPHAVKSRIKTLEKDNVILGYRVMINYPLLKCLHYRVFLHIENATEQKERSIVEFLGSKKQVISVTKTIGYCELEFRAVIKEMQEIYDVLEELRSHYPEIKEYDLLAYYKFHSVLNYYPFTEEVR